MQNYINPTERNRFVFGSAEREKEALNYADAGVESESLINIEHTSYAMYMKI